MNIKIDINDRDVRQRLAQLAAGCANLKPLMSNIGEEIRRMIEKNFAVGGRPDAWKPSARSRREGGMPLSDTGRLRRSFTVDAETNRVRVGTNVKYARIHQFGGTTKAHIIRAKNKKVLFWPGAKHPVIAVLHPGSKIPARPFLTVTDDDQRQISDMICKYIVSLYERGGTK